VRALLEFFCVLPHPFFHPLLLQSSDLTELAKSGKLDPVIGREEGKWFFRFLAFVDSGLIHGLVEIRRTIQSMQFPGHICSGPG